VAGEQNSDGELTNTVPIPMSKVEQDGDTTLYSAIFTPERSGALAVAVRVRADRQYQIDPIEPGLLVRWA
jgi:hypothetical protein